MMNTYHYKKSDDAHVVPWKSVNCMRKAKRNALVFTFLTLALIFWHTLHSHTVLTKSSRRDKAEEIPDARVRDHQRGATTHQYLHDQRGKNPYSTTGYSQGSNSDASIRHQNRDQPATEHETSEDIALVAVDDLHREARTPGADDDPNVQVRLPVKESVPADDDATSHSDAADDHNEQPVVWKKGPVQVQANLDADHAKEPILLVHDGSDKHKVLEAEPEAHLVLEETAESLPEIIHIPFEDVLEDHTLEGWEDQWLSTGTFNNREHTLKEPRIDFVYLWVNGSEEAFQNTKRPFEENSVLNDADGKWLSSHGVNRYRSWDELRYAIRSVEKYAGAFRNQIQIIVNSVYGTDSGKQVPTWLKRDPSVEAVIKVMSQEEFMDKKAQACLPTFNSLTIENQLFNTPSDTDYMFALSDDMLLGRQHAASDIVSPLFGPVMGFKTNQYNTVKEPTEEDARRFGEKPFLIYTSWLLNRRFGQRKRKGQGHFGHSLSRDIMREAIQSFPGPELESACKRFRGEPGFQLYSWFVTFHYLIERHREAMLWSLITLRTDIDRDGYLSWDERKDLITALTKGMANEGKGSFRKRFFYHVRQYLEKAGLEAPKVNTDFLWTSLDGPSSFIKLQCEEFDVNECLAPGFSVSMSDYSGKVPAFSAAVIFERVARQQPDCGDCLLKLVLNQVKQGLEPILPSKISQPSERQLAVKALMRYKYTIVEPNGLFTMLTDAEQIDKMLVERYIKNNTPLPGQLCLNDDVDTQEEAELQDIQFAMNEFYEGLFPRKSDFEI